MAPSRKSTKNKRPVFYEQISEEEWHKARVIVDEAALPTPVSGIGPFRREETGTTVVSKATNKPPRYARIVAAAKHKLNTLPSPKVAVSTTPVTKADVRVETVTSPEPPLEPRLDRAR